MSCLTTKHKLIILCCCTALIAIVSSIMVINAFFQWAGPLNETLTLSQTTGSFEPFSTVRSNVNIGTEPNSHPIKVTIYHHPLSKEEPVAKHNWFAVEKDEEIEFIDIDDEDVIDISGSGQEGEKESHQTTILPIKHKSSTTKLPHTESSQYNNSADIENDDNTLNCSGDGESTTLTPQDSNTASKIRIGSTVTHPTVSDTEDKCEQWLKCEDPFLKDYLKKFSQLPSCPCIYPLKHSASVWDEDHQKYFTWKDSQFTEAYLTAYNSGADKCIRSEIFPGTFTAQNCCYDKEMKLVTRGSGAGTPDVISLDVSQELHNLLDKIPWVLCKGDWTRYNAARPPNNVRNCIDNPTNIVFLYQIWLAKNV